MDGANVLCHIRTSWRTCASTYHFYFLTQYDPSPRFTNCLPRFLFTIRAHVLCYAKHCQTLPPGSSSRDEERRRVSQGRVSRSLTKFVHAIRKSMDQSLYPAYLHLCSDSLISVSRDGQCSQQGTSNKNGLVQASPPPESPRRPAARRVKDDVRGEAMW